MILKIDIKNWNKGILVALVIITSGFAQITSPLKIVLNVNPKVKAAELSYKSALEKVKVAGNLPDPMVDGSFSINAIETRNGPVNNQLMLGQKFPLWGKLRRERNIERVKAEISKLNVDIVKINISFTLRKLLSEQFKLTNSLNILKQYQEEIETFKYIAQSQYANGIGLTQHPIIKLQIEESLVESKINSFEIALEKNIIELQVLFDGQYSANIIKNYYGEKLKPESTEVWLSRAINQNPKYYQAQARIAMASDQIKLAKLKNYPDLVAGLTYAFVGPTDLGGAVSSGEDAFGVRVGINLPLWFKKNKAKVKAVTYTKKQKEELLLATWNKIESEILSIIKELDEIKETYILYDESIIYDTEQMLSSAYTAYETGKISFLDLLDSVRLGVKVKLEFEGIKAKQTTLVAMLYQATGIINPDQENNNEN